MPERWRFVFVLLVFLIPIAGPASAGVPDLSNSFYVPQGGDPDPAGAPAGSFSIMAPQVLVEGTVAARLFRMCPNNDGGASLPNNARIKVVVRDINGVGIPNIAAADICVLFNGGTAIQNFSGVGADSIIANSTFNPSPLCPDVRCIAADRPTNAGGVTFITFTGADPATPGVGQVYPFNNRQRKWGHYDTELPVYALGFKLSGRLTTVGSVNGSYVLRIKNIDWTGGTDATLPLNRGETVTVTDFNGIANGIGSTNAISYWKDFDGVGGVQVSDLNIITNHLNHDCDTGITPGVP